MELVNVFLNADTANYQLLIMAKIYFLVQIGWILMTEPVTAKREQVSKKEEDKEDNTSVQEIMVSDYKTISK